MTDCALRELEKKPEALGPCLGKAELVLSLPKGRDDERMRCPFDVTQDFLAFMLGVRRVGVTAAARTLQSRNLIRYSRGHLDIFDRKGLEAAACVC